jgi:hypothetical protein
VTKPKNSLFSNTLAVLLASLVFILGLIAVYPDAHHFIHKDSDESGHSCAVTLYSQGTTLTTAGVFILEHQLFVVGKVLKPESLFLQTSLYYLKPERGPPRLGA